MKYLLILGALIFTNCTQGQDLVAFPQEALNDVFVTEVGANITFGDVLEEHKGKTIVIDVWATWCRDCIVGMPKVKALQAEFKDAVFVFLSLDKTEESWKRGIKKYKLEGEHYFVSGGWKSPFCKAIDLDWIPRYMVVNPLGEIAVYRAVEADDFRLRDALKSKSISENDN